MDTGQFQTTRDKTGQKFFFLELQEIRKYIHIVTVLVHLITTVQVPQQQ